MIDIFGGVYRERCFLDISDELYGSAGRAACALTEIAREITLHSYFSIKSLENFRLIADAFNFAISETMVDYETSFEYFHSLSHPKIFPLDCFQNKHPAIKANVKNGLQFGMIDGDSVIEGDCIVYDPQSPHSPKWFHENGSKAKHLAYVLNFQEGSLLTGCSDVQQITQKILDNGAVVAVLKMGSDGTVINDGKSLRHISCIETERVRSIGSGDIFSAIFANSWAVEKLHPVLAAENASKATAYYCNNGCLPIPKSYLTNFGKSYAISNYQIENQRKIIASPKVYLAGPFFNMAEVWMAHECREILISFGLEVFSPYHDVGIGPAKIVAKKDLDGLKECNVVLAILNGLDPGTIFEIGYAVSRNIPVIVFVQNEKAENLKMIEGTGCFITDDFSTAIYKTAWANRKS